MSSLRVPLALRTPGFTAAALAAAFWPAHRASRVDPITALRVE